MAAARPTILLTGFGPFPGIDDNATTALVPELAVAARDHFPRHQVIGEILPVEWQRGPQLLQQLLAETNPAIALHFGVTKHASGFQIELVGRNVCGPRIDAVGEFPPAAHVVEAGPETIASSFPAERIIARLERAGLACTTSESAGTYLCNALLYHSLARAQAQPMPCIAGFIHLPAGLSAKANVEAECRLSWDDALNGSIEIIAACVEAETTA